MRRYLLSIILLSGLCLGARGQTEPLIDLSGLPEQTTASSLRYWFDADAGSNLTTTTLSGATTIDASALLEGIHILHYQIVDSKGIAGIPESKMFLRLVPRVNAKAEKLRYWFDTDDNSIKTTSTFSGATIIDASALLEGIHILHYQIVDDQGNGAIPVSAMFIKLAKQMTATPIKLRYWFDSDMTTVADKELTGAQTIDASTLADGIHTLHYQIVDDQGTAGIPFSAMFLKLGQKAKAEATAILYWFDEAGDDVKESDITNLTTTIDARPLKKGEHVLHYQLKLSDGTLSPASSVTFDVTALRGDANGDRQVTITDAVSVVNYILGNPADGFDIEAANVNGDVDGEGQPSITITDAVGIVNIILSGE